MICVPTATRLAGYATPRHGNLNTGNRTEARTGTKTLRTETILETLCAGLEKRRGDKGYSGGEIIGKEEKKAGQSVAERVRALLAA